MVVVKGPVRFLRNINANQVLSRCKTDQELVAEWLLCSQDGLSSPHVSAVEPSEREFLNVACLPSFGENHKRRWISHECQLRNHVGNAFPVLFSNWFKNMRRLTTIRLRSPVQHIFNGWPFMWPQGLTCTHRCTCVSR